MAAFHDKAVLIPGGSSGIGRGVALRLAQLGCRVAIAARNPKSLDSVVEEIQALKADAIAVPTDVTDPEQCRHPVDSTVGRFRPLDILVTSPGLSIRPSF